MSLEVMSLEVMSVWQQVESSPYPDWLLSLIQEIAPELSGDYAAQLLWQRGLREQAIIAGFLDPDRYTPTSPFAFGPEMKLAVERLAKARTQGEHVTIWGDFDADGVTATSVLWEGLGQFLTPHTQLDYFIPNRLTESHGLNRTGIDAIAASGTQLIVTCDTGSTNHEEITYARAKGIDTIVTDHHTLVTERPDVVALINPRSLPPEHPLAHLSGVAVAYKLVEAWYETEPDIPVQPLESLLDLVAIGLIADLVALKGDCRYLAQRGIAQLQTLLTTRARPGVAKLLELCKREGNRPTDISFGIGPRINAVSRIKGEAGFCVELLTSQEVQRCETLAIETELANNRRKALQREIKQQVLQTVDRLDFSTTQVIVLADTQWPIGILGLVAGEVAQTYNRPTILLQVFSPDGSLDHPEAIARGSARSVQGIDLYELVKTQSHLLNSFGGHPFAAGLSLAMKNLPLLTQAVNQALRLQQQGQPVDNPSLHADLAVSVAELGQALFRELKLLEPYGIGNPVPKLLIQNCWFEQVANRNLKDFKGAKLRYIKTSFVICDASCEQGFPGVWWEHYQDEVAKGTCDALVELDFNSYRRCYEVRLLAIQPHSSVLNPATMAESLCIEDGRNQGPASTMDNQLVLDYCPTNWTEVRQWGRQAQQHQKTLRLAYETESLPSAAQVWSDLVGVAKYLLRSEASMVRSQWMDQFKLSPQALNLGLEALQENGFLILGDETIQIRQREKSGNEEVRSRSIQRFLLQITEEYFLRQYFQQVSVETLGSVIKTQ